MDRDDYMYLKSKIEKFENKLVKEKPETIKIKYLADIEHIKPIVNGDWIDLRISEDVSMAKGEYRLLPLGIAMQLPEGYEAIVAPRSSTHKNYKILMTNSIGVIDESYCGNDDMWRFPAYATEGTFIPKNTRLCQFRIIKHQPAIHFEEVEDLGNENRGGIGSTGVM